jgi:hypothetical protein
MASLSAFAAPHPPLPPSLASEEEWGKKDENYDCKDEEEVGEENVVATAQDNEYFFPFPFF